MSSLHTARLRCGCRLSPFALGLSNTLAWVDNHKSRVSKSDEEARSGGTPDRNEVFLLDKMLQRKRFELVSAKETIGQLTAMTHISHRRSR